MTAFGLPVRLNARVTSLTRTDEGFEVRTANGTIHTRQVVVATGPFQVPFCSAGRPRARPRPGHPDPQCQLRQSRRPCPTDRRWSSEAATLGSSIPEESPRRAARSTCPSVIGHPRRPSGWSAGRFRRGRPGSARADQVRVLAGEPVVGSSSSGPTEAAARQGRRDDSGRDWSRLKGTNSPVR